VPMFAISLVCVLIVVGWNQDLRVIARSNLNGTIQFPSKLKGDWDSPGVVIRSEEELVAACRLKEDPAQKQLSEILAKEFKVDKIDWQIQMVVAIDIGSVEDTSLEIGRLKVNGRVFTLNYNLHHVRAGRKPPQKYLGEMLLVERIDGEFQFRKTVTVSGNPHAK